ncbi:MAG TPA: helix-turn-helix domain-containing protein [Candidatus Andersenbacteria bacterium]|nr:helix-turn-helix domain-containing protein [Candidatus Andersenbacteria bacterium]
MKHIQKREAIRLRKKGWSINDIYKKLDVAKGTVSVWVRDVSLTPAQLQELAQRSHARSAVEKRRTSRLLNESNKRQLVVDNAKSDITQVTKSDLFLIGVMLYWAEGGKKQRGSVRFSNSDPLMIRVMMRFFRVICMVPEEKFRIHLHIHMHLDYQKAEKYWSKITGIPLNHFYKTYNAPNKGSQNKKDNLPNGTIQVYVSDTILFLKIQGWTAGIANKIFAIT